MNIGASNGAVHFLTPDRGSTFKDSEYDTAVLYVYSRNNPVNWLDPTGLWELRCREIVGVTQRHCWIECDGHSYSLNKYDDGIAMPKIDDPADLGKGKIEASGPDKCGCIADQFRNNPVSYEYDKDDCNSNYFASSLLRCCNIAAERPSRAYGWGNCQRQVGKFECLCPVIPATIDIG